MNDKGTTKYDRKQDAHVSVYQSAGSNLIRRRTGNSRFEIEHANAKFPRNQEIPVGCQNIHNITIRVKMVV